MARQFPSVANAFRRAAEELERTALLGPLEEYLQEWQKLAIEKAPTQDIKANIAIIPPKRQGRDLRMGLEVDLTEGHAPEGAAYEFGSGIHSPESPGTYPIRPRKKKALAFFWEKANPSIPVLPDGRVVLPGVEHPGVEARPYLIPALKETIRPPLIRAIAFAMRVSIVTAFKEEAEKGG